MSLYECEVDPNKVSVFEIENGGFLKGWDDTRRKWANRRKLFWWKYEEHYGWLLYDARLLWGLELKKL